MSSLSDHAPAAVSAVTLAAQPTIVLALGNPLRGDDGVGGAVLAALAQVESLPGGVTLLDGGTPGLETVLLLDGYRRAIIVDAAAMGLQPGQWRRFDRQQARLHYRDAAFTGTLHHAGLAEALVLGDALQVLPAEIVIYGVQPAALGWMPGLSEPVQRAVPAVCTAILNEL